MRFPILTSFLTLSSSVFALANPTTSARSASGDEKGIDIGPSTRPHIHLGPKTPRKSPPQSLPRTKTCSVESHNDGITDDAPFIIKALQTCNNGGHVIFTLGTNYTIGTAMNLTFLNSIDIEVQGYVKFTNNTTYWQAHSFPQIFQNVTTFFQLGGNDVNFFGTHGGTIDGNGQVWYDLYAENDLILRPTLIGVIGLHNSTISNLNLRFSPTYYHFVANSTNVVFDGINIAGLSTSVNVAKNTDGWDTYRSEDITIQNSHIDNGDDCVSFKPNSTFILVQNLFCNGSHGISVGSLGQYVGEFDIVSDVYVYNISLLDTSDGARIKVWPGSPAELSGDLQGGGGDGRVTNITYDTLTVKNTDYAIEVDQCYGQNNLTLCLQFPSTVTISDVLFTNFTGVTSTKFSPQIGSFACSDDTVCSGITTEDISVLSPKGTNESFCLNIDESTLQGFTCVTSSDGFN
jgi:galacturan 1,4-alpha-galacturonidase